METEPSIYRPEQNPVEEYRELRKRDSLLKYFTAGIFHQLLPTYHLIYTAKCFEILSHELVTSPKANFICELHRPWAVPLVHTYMMIFAKKFNIHLSDSSAVK
jgi:hypothetical protein